LFTLSQSHSAVKPFFGPIISCSAAALALLLAGCGGGDGGTDAGTSAQSGTASPALQASQAPQAAPASQTSSVAESTDGAQQADAPATSSAPANETATTTDTAQARRPASTTTATTTPTASTTTAAGTSTSTTSTTATAALPASLTCGLNNFQAEIMRLVNEARASSRYCGSTLYPAASPLKWNAQLFNAAAGHSSDMAGKNYFSHTGLDGSTFSQRITAAGYAWKTAGENIAAGQSSIQSAMNGWLQSPGHCANIMKASYVDVGVSCAQNSASTYKLYWTMELAAPR
jgi:uncharacterized protein YkwD